MEPRDPDFRKRVTQIFERSAFVQALGIQIEASGPGWCETSLNVRPDHLQQDGMVHAGVLATLADHTGGAAGCSLLAPDVLPLTAEFKINLLRAARTDRLRCRADVLKPGRRLSVVESAVFADLGGQEKLVAKATVTLAILPLPDGDSNG